MDEEMGKICPILTASKSVETRSTDGYAICLGTECMMALVIRDSYEPIKIACGLAAPTKQVLYAEHVTDDRAIWNEYETTE